MSRDDVFDSLDDETFVGYSVGGRPVVIKNTFIELGESGMRRRTFSHHRSRSLPESLPSAGVSEQDLEGASQAASSATRGREVPFGGLIEEDETKEPEFCWMEPKAKEIETQTEFSDFVKMAEVTGVPNVWQRTPIGFAKDLGERAAEIAAEMERLKSRPLPPSTTIAPNADSKSAAATPPTTPASPPLRAESSSPSASPSASPSRSKKQLDPNASCFIPGLALAECEDRRSEASTSCNQGADSEDSDECNSHRTTVMIRNLPEGATRGMLEQLLDKEGFAACYDFIYVPSDIASGASFFYAFVNLVSPAEARRFQRHFTHFSNWLEPCDKESVVDWSEALQGLFALAERYRNSPLMHKTVPDGLRPAMYRDGKRIQFPPPTRQLRAPRLRRGAPKLPRERGRIGVADEEDDECGMGAPLPQDLLTSGMSTPTGAHCLSMCEEASGHFSGSPLGAGMAFTAFKSAVIVDSAAILTRPCPR